MNDERKHCDDVARAALDAPIFGLASLADLIQRERANLLARAEAAEADRDHWKASAVAVADAAKRDTAGLRAKLTAAEARRGRLADLLLGIGQEIGLAPDADCPMDTWASWIVAHSKHKSEKAKAAAGEMRALLETLCLYHREDRPDGACSDGCGACRRKALLAATEAGRGWVSSEAHAAVVKLLRAITDSTGPVDRDRAITAADAAMNPDDWK